MIIYNHEFLIFNHANSGIANINHCLSLGLTKTDYEMSLNCAGHSTQSLKYEKFERKLLGCEILGTAARTLVPLTNFPRATPPSYKHRIWEGKTEIHAASSNAQVQR